MEPSHTPIVVSGTALKMPDNPKLDGLPPRIVTWDAALDRLAELAELTESDAIDSSELD